MPAPFYLGIVLESSDSRLVAAAQRDLFNFRCTLDSRTPLVVVSNMPDLLLQFARSLGVSVEVYLPTDTSPSKASACKAYYSEICPDPPPGTVDFYSMQVVPSGRNVQHLTPHGREGYPSLDRAVDNQMVPPGASPNINRIPPNVVNVPFQPFGLL